LAISVQSLQDFVILSTASEELSEQDVADCIKAIRGNPSKNTLFVLNFSKIDVISAKPLRELVVLAKEAKDKGSRISVLCKKDLAKFIQDKGLERVLPCFTEIVRPPSAESVAETQADPKKQFLLSMVNELKSVVEKTSKVALSCGKPEFAKEWGLENVHVVGYVDVTSKIFSGAVVIGFPLEFYLHLMSSMLGRKYESMEPEIRDWAGEFLNIASGKVKGAMNAGDLEVDYSIPKVIPTEEAKQVMEKLKPFVLVPFSAGGSSFYVAINTAKPPGSGEPKS
jgi:CheY-specific phosphatase CheX